MHDERGYVPSFFLLTIMRPLGKPAVLSLVIFALQFSQIHAVYVPLREYAGSTFFDGWDYWGDVDNTTWGVPCPFMRFP